MPQPPPAPPRKHDVPPVGAIFGLYTVISAPKRRNTSLAVQCRCRCGKETWVPVVVLVERRRGCWDCVMRKYGRPEIGKKYHRLTVTGVYQKDSWTFATCQCDCGNIREVYGSALCSGYTKECVPCAKPNKYARLGLRCANGDYHATCPGCKRERKVNITSLKDAEVVPLCGKCKRQPRRKVQLRAKCPSCGFYRKTRKWLGDPDPLCSKCSQ